MVHCLHFSKQPLIFTQTKCMALACVPSGGISPSGNTWGDEFRASAETGTGCLAFHIARCFLRSGVTESSYLGVCSDPPMLENAVWSLFSSFERNNKQVESS